ncbi:MAG TPA: hypothetical protein VGT05_02980, partial [Patescibacteria group bacterium]|nr:hypothetical protein [Patescibacteria group bacterium]
PVPSLLPTGSPVPSDTPTPQPAVLSLTVGLDGIGVAGDAAHPLGGGNHNPKHPTRSVAVTVSDLSNTQVQQGQGIMVYDPVSGLFKGTVALSVATGNYLLTIQTDGFLVKQITSPVHIVSQQTTQMPRFTMVNGDVDNDNQLDITDYNAIVSCYGDNQTTPTCTNPPTTQDSGADITDDGVVNGDDFNLFLREIRGQAGQ